MGYRPAELENELENILYVIADRAVELRHGPSHTRSALVGSHTSPENKKAADELYRVVAKLRRLLPKDCLFNQNHVWGER